jgi:hypothetical protein
MKRRLSRRRGDLNAAQLARISRSKITEKNPAKCFWQVAICFNNDK